MNLCGAILIAAGNDWLGVLVPIVFFVIYVLNQLLSGKGKPPARHPQRRGPQQGERPLRPAAPPGAPQAGAPGGPQQAQLNAEIEQFLKRAAQRRGERPLREAPRAKPPPSSPPKAPPRPPREEPVDVAPLERDDFSSVAASVQKHMSDRGFAQRAEHLTDDISRADQQMEEHLQKAFGHRVGTLTSGAALAKTSPVTDTESEPIVAPSPVAAGLAAVLASPQDLRQAIVLAEILARPEHRW